MEENKKSASPNNNCGYGTQDCISLLTSGWNAFLGVFRSH